jgi:L-2,4-diaminobutyrate decarboxylase
VTAVVPGTTAPARARAGHAAPVATPPGADVGALVALSLDALAAGRAARGGPVPAGTPRQVAADVDAALGGGVLPEVGTGERAALTGLVAAVAAGAADPADPACAAHLHCPPLPVAVAADLAASALNQSLDSWDQAPAATVLEERVVAALADLAGLAGGTGVLTTGGTGSTYTALLLARDADAGPVRLYASAAAHFSVERAAHLLGLPPVVAVPLGSGQAMDAAALAALLRDAPAGERPVVVATAGTTDLGSVDPLPAIGDLVDAAGGWLHVDAAYGGGVLFSDRRRHLLAGIDRAASVSLDLHKFGWQPAAAGVLLTRDAAAFSPLARRAAYLNPADDEAAGYPSLLGRSLRTTRRADVLKIAVTLRALGRTGLGALVDACCDLAAYAAARVRREPRLQLAADPVLSTVVFRHRGGGALNAQVRRRLLREGRAVVGRTELAGQVFLKLTLLNPAATPADVDALLDLVLAAARAEEDAA